MVNYTLKQLYSFEAVIRLKSFSKAATELNITQPAVYTQVQQLQKNIGIDLIVVNGKTVTPTFIGEKIFETSKDVIFTVESSKKEIQQTLDPDSGHLNIIVATTTNSFVSRVLAEFKSQNPKMTFHLEILNRSDILQRMKQKQFEFIIMGEPPSSYQVNAEVFMENPLIAICHPEHSLLGQKNININALQDEVLITREQGSGTRESIERITGLNFNSEVEINSNEAITHAVRAGLGIGFVSEWTVELELKTNSIAKLDLKDFPIIRHWYVAHHKDLSQIEKKFKNFIISKGNKNL